MAQPAVPGQKIPGQVTGPDVPAATGLGPVAPARPAAVSETSGPAVGPAAGQGPAADADRPRARHSGRRDVRDTDDTTATPAGVAPANGSDPGAPAGDTTTPAGVAAMSLPRPRRRSGRGRRGPVRTGPAPTRPLPLTGGAPTTAHDTDAGPGRSPRQELTRALCVVLVVTLAAEILLRAVHEPALGGLLDAAAAAAAAVACLLRRPVDAGWRLLAAGAGTAAAGQAFAAAPHTPPTHGIPLLAGLCLVAVGALVLHHRILVEGGVARLTLDTLLTACAFGYIVSTGLPEDSVGASSLAACAAPVMLGTVGLIAASRSHRGTRLPVILSCAALTVLAVMAGGVAWSEGWRSPADTGVPHTAWVVGWLLLAMTARWPDDGRPQDDGPENGRLRRLLVSLPHIPIQAAIVSFVLSHSTGGFVGALPVWGATLFAVAAYLRQVLTLRDTETLAQSLHETVQDLRASEAALTRRAFEDPLTGLGNRAQLLDRLQEALTGTGERRPRALVFLDLDDFKVVNDTLGHAAGDALLKEIARRLRAGTPAASVVARMGGDEFAVLSSLTPGGSPEGLGEAVVGALRVPVRLGGQLLPVSGSAGAALLPDPGAPGATVEEVLRRADVAMYAAKAAGKGRAVTFHAGMYDAAMARMTMEADLRSALADLHIHLHYQPVVDLTTGAAVGVEALARWSHPVRGGISPAEFIAVAEDSELICELGEHVLRSACGQLAAWDAELADASPEHVAVNVSTRQLRRPDFVEVVADTLRATGLSPDRLVLEITETAVMDDADGSLGTLLELRAAGIRLLVDDFGTGHSSLARLRQMPVSGLKVDRSFIDGAAGMVDAPIVTATLGMARSLGLTVVAEGVETWEQLAFLRDLGCQLGQGFLLGRPADPETCAASIRERSAGPASEGDAVVVPRRARGAGARSTTVPQVAALLADVRGALRADAVWFTSVDWETWTMTIDAADVDETLIDLRAGVSWDYHTSLLTRMAVREGRVTATDLAGLPDSRAGRMRMSHVLSAPVQLPDGRIGGAVHAAMSSRQPFDPVAPTTLRLFAALLAATCGTPAGGVGERGKDDGDDDGDGDGDVEGGDDGGGGGPPASAGRCPLPGDRGSWKRAPRPGGSATSSPPRSPCCAAPCGPGR